MSAHKMIKLEKAILRPVEYPDLVRLGPNGDGGYVVPEDQVSRADVLISMGLSDNWKFEKDFFKRNPQSRIIGIDHTVGGVWFLRRGLVYAWKILMYTLLGKRGKAAKYSEKLWNAMDYFSFFNATNIHLRRKVSHEDRGIDISVSSAIKSGSREKNAMDIFLKIDIEGAEYEVWQDIVQNQKRIRCIVAEFHDLDTRTEEFNRCVAGLLDWFFIVHIHANNGAAYDTVNDFPSVMEITFVNKRAIDHVPAPSTFEYPRAGLDFPNNPGVPEYRIKFE